MRQDQPTRPSPTGCHCAASRRAHRPAAKSGPTSIDVVAGSATIVVTPSGRNPLPHVGRRPAAGSTCCCSPYFETANPQLGARLAGAQPMAGTVSNTDDPAAIEAAMKRSAEEFTGSAAGFAGAGCSGRLSKNH